MRIRNFLQIADTLLLVYGANQHTDYYGDLCLSCLCSQGLGTTFHVIQVCHHLTCSTGVIPCVFVHSRDVAKIIQLKKPSVVDQLKNLYNSGK